MLNGNALAPEGENGAKGSLKVKGRKKGRKKEERKEG